jgi:hypothetical protein
MDFRDAQRTLWGQAGAWSYDAWHDLNAAYFDDELTYHGVVWGLTPHGGKLGYCEPSERITLHSSLVDPRGTKPWGWESDRFTDRLARDVLLHEMIHAQLFARGNVQRDDRGGHHNTPEWCAEIERLTPLLLDIEVKAEPVRPRRIEGKVTRKTNPGHLTRADAAHWPHSVRPRAASYYRGGEHLSFASLAEIR